MNWWQELGTAVLIILAVWLLGWISRWVLQWATAQITGRTKASLDDAVVAAAQTPLQLCTRRSMKREMKFLFHSEIYIWFHRALAGCRKVKFPAK